MRIIISLIFFLSLQACTGTSEQLIDGDISNGAVSLVEFSTRGATGRYLGALQQVKASHPIVLPTEAVNRLLSGIQLGILPSEPATDHPGIKPAPLFSASEVAALAPGIATALKQAGPHQYVKFQIGAAPETTAGSLYVEGPAIQFSITHYHSTVHRQDKGLSVYVLSFVPQSAQVSSKGTRSWIDGESNNPRLAIAYALLDNPKSPAPVRSVTNPATPHQSHPIERTSGADTSAMEDLVKKQAQELDALKKELDAIKKQLGHQTSPSNSTTEPPGEPRSH